jgi:prepilin-type N-terminal cleavage/methylation domain-containing protein
MAKVRNNAGFTILEMISAIAIIAILSVIYLFLIDSYRERRMSEQAAKVLMLAAKVQEEYFAKEQKYFDAEVSGNGGEVYLTTPDGAKTQVRIPARVVLSLKAKNKDRRFTGSAFYTGGKIVHQYDSTTGKMTTTSRAQDEAG